MLLLNARSFADQKKADANVRPLFFGKQAKSPAAVAVTAFRAMEKLVVPSWQGWPVLMARFHAVAKTAAPAAVKTAAPAAVKMDAMARFHAAEPIRVAAAMGARCVAEPIHEVHYAESRGVPSADETVAVHTVWAILRVTAAVHTVWAIRYAMDDQLQSRELNASNLLNHATDCYVRFPASFASAAACVRRFDIRCHARGDPGERSVRPERELAVWKPHLHHVSVRFDPATRCPVEHRALDANRLNQAIRLYPDCPRDQTPGQACVRSPELPGVERFRFVRLSDHESEPLATV